MSNGSHVLVVDDEPLSRDMLVRRLTSRGFDVEGLADGASCLARIEEGGVDLLLLDVAMPDMDGLSVLRNLRQRHDARSLPVILVTAMVDSDDVVRGLEAGANDYVVKPVNMPVLLARMNVCLAIKQSVERLLEAERQRVMLQTLSATANSLSQPLTPLMGSLELLVRRPPQNWNEISRQLIELLGWTRDAQQLIHRLSEVADMHPVPYTERIGMLGSRPGDGH